MEGQLASDDTADTIPRNGIKSEGQHRLPIDGFSFDFNSFRRVIDQKSLMNLVRKMFIVIYS